MVYQEKHNKFLYNGYRAVKTLTQKVSVIDDKYNISKKSKIIKEDVIGVSKLMYEDIDPIVKAIHKQYIKSPIPGFISLSLKSLSEIKKDINLNPLSSATHEQIKKIDKKHFLIVGLACLVLSGVTLEYKHNLNTLSQSFNIHLNLSQPTANPANDLVESLPPMFMKSVFNSKLEAFIKLLGITEGKANFFYKDNLGVATAYGWNPTKNSKEFNVDVAYKIGMSTSQVKSIAKISANSTIQSVPTSLKKVILSDKQIQKSAEIMLQFYEAEFLKVMKIKSQQNGKDYNDVLHYYHQLPNNQQAVMVHMAYKVGTKNLLKYDIFFKRLFTYMEHPTTINLNKVTANFDYLYKTKSGDTLHDTRVEKTHNEFFNECSITDSDQKEKMKQQVKSCRQFVVSNTIKINNKG